MFRGDDGDKGEFAREFVLQDFILGPRVDAIEDDALLAGSDEVFGLGDGLLNHPIFTFGLANHFAKFAFAVWGALNPTFFHFFINHTTEVDFRDATFGEIVDGDGFTGTTHADDGEDFYISSFHDFYYSID